MTSLIIELAGTLWRRVACCALKEANTLQWINVGSNCAPFEKEKNSGVPNVVLNMLTLMLWWVALPLIPGFHPTHQRVK